MSDWRADKGAVWYGRGARIESACIYRAIGIAPEPGRGRQHLHHSNALLIS